MSLISWGICWTSAWPRIVWELTSWRKFREVMSVEGDRSIEQKCSDLLDLSEEPTLIFSYIRREKSLPNVFWNRLDQNEFRFVYYNFFVQHVRWHLIGLCSSLLKVYFIGASNNLSHVLTNIINDRGIKLVQMVSYETREDKLFSIFSFSPSWHFLLSAFSLPLPLSPFTCSPPLFPPPLPSIPSTPTPLTPPHLLFQNLILIPSSEKRWREKKSKLFYIWHHTQWLLFFHVFAGIIHNTFVLVWNFEWSVALWKIQ